MTFFLSEERWWPSRKSLPSWPEVPHWRKEADNHLWFVPTTHKGLTVTTEHCIFRTMYNYLGKSQKWWLAHDTSMYNSVLSGSRWLPLQCRKLRVLCASVSPPPALMLRLSSTQLPCWIVKSVNSGGLVPCFPLTVVSLAQCRLGYSELSPCWLNLLH